MEKTMSMERMENEVIMNRLPEMFRYLEKWEQMKEVVLPMLIYKNGESDNCLLVRKEYLDMAIIYYVDIKGFPGYIKVTYSLLNTWGISEEELHQASMKNLSERGICLFTLKDFMRHLMEENKDDEAFKDLSVPLECLPGPDIYVLTTEEKSCGAALIMLPEVRRFISEHIGTDRYIVLPSSRHEVLIVPESVNFSLEYYKEMVRSVNDTTVPARDLLSYSIYANRDSELQKVA